MTKIAEDRADSPRLGLAAALPDLPAVSPAVEQLLSLQRIGTVMVPDPDRPEEAWGVLNPASARSRDGQLYLFPRVVAKGNYSRIAIAAVRFDARRNPTGVERLGLALEPEKSYEVVKAGVGGVEDPRITYIALLDSYVMAYTALGPAGARIALAVSKDLHTWTRLGPLHFEVADGIDLNPCNNKDCVVFPIPLVDPNGCPSFALLHRPIFVAPRSEGAGGSQHPPGLVDRRPSIWISYVSTDRVEGDLQELTRVRNHHLLAQPLGSWEHHHIGSGAPPILSEEGWLLYYHGVIAGEAAGVNATTMGLVYQSGVMLLDREDPRHVLYRSSRPVLVPEEPGEREGIAPNVVFPTAVDIQGNRVDVYYGAADERISAAQTQISGSVLLPPSAPSARDGPQEAGGYVLLDGGVDRETGLSRLVDRRIGITEEASLTSHPPAGRQAYKRIVVALDGSPLAERVLESIVPLAQKFASTVTLLRVVAPDNTPTRTDTIRSRGDASSQGQVMVAVAPIVGDRHEETVAYLQNMRRRLEAEGVTAQNECPEGKASEVILRRARELGADLIALTTHGRTGVTRLLLGSVAEQVIRAAGCPVHLVRVSGEE